MRQEANLFLGINLGVDPTVAIVKDGIVLSCSEEERHVRLKHAANLYPVRALRYCLEEANAKPEDINALCVNWDIPSYTDGRMKAFYEDLRNTYDVDDNTIKWQSRNLALNNLSNFRNKHRLEWGKIFGVKMIPPIYPIGHHFVHAFQAFHQSNFGNAICVTVDGSGDKHCTVVWLCGKEEGIKPIREICIPHSLGWFYAAFTEYLGFSAYDGEYKVMGLAAYGHFNKEIKDKISQVLFPAKDGIEYNLDPAYIHYGAHSYSDRFTDKLVDLLGRPPRLPDEEVDDWHMELAFAVQEQLEDSVNRLVTWAIFTTGVSNVCVSGGVGHNVKMNSSIFNLPEVKDIFPHPLCGDSGAAIGAALAGCYQLKGILPEKLKTVSLGFQESNTSIEEALQVSKVQYERHKDICQATAKELADGRIVAWFQGRMEAGPRALGCRSILADPRKVSNRDKINSIVKFREPWRPFCPSILAEHAGRYFENYVVSPFMIIAFKANERLQSDAPAVVHIDGTCRVQFVEEKANPLFHKLISSFEHLTGVPILLNTSFNVKGEPIVCTISDALRTFWSTGLEILVAGDFMIKKPNLDK
jgi:carbamoyltransferase